MTITLTDFFCGAGGSSAGAALVNGVELKAALNHWDRAIETHAENHPAARHILADISQFEPSLTPRTTIAWLSPSCTKHSIAQGKKLADAQPDLFGEVLPDAAAERSRATMWDVTVTTHGHQSLLTAERSAVSLDDVRFRMLEPSEIKRAMDFPAEYIGKGTRREQVRLWGNAVTPPAARDLVHLVAESLGRK